MSDTPTTVVGIWKAILVRSANWQSLLLNSLVVGGFGFLVPWRWGFDFFSPIVVMSYTAVALLFAASAVTGVIAAAGPAPAFVPTIFASTLHAWTLLVLIYGLGIASVNFAIQAPRFLHPNWALTGAALVFALAASLFFAAFSATLSVLFSPSSARTAVRVLFLALLLAIVYGKPRLPAMWQVSIDRQLTTAGLTNLALASAAIATVLASGMIFAFRRR